MKKTNIAKKMGTIKASDILGIDWFNNGQDKKYFITDVYVDNDENIFSSEEEAKNYLKDLDKLEHYKAHVKQLRDALKEYEQWETDLIMNDESWENGLPEMTAELYDNFIDIQEIRNKALKETE